MSSGTHNSFNLFFFNRNSVDKLYLIRFHTNAKERTIKADIMALESNYFCHMVTNPPPPLFPSGRV